MDENAMADEVADDADTDAPETLGPEALFEKNIALLEKYKPTLAKTIRDHKPLSKLIYKDNGEPSIDFQGFDVYPKGAKTEADEQFANKKAHLSRLFFNKPDADAFDLHVEKQFKHALSRCEESGISFSTFPTREQGYFLIVFGVGLGQHLDRLVEDTGCHVLTIVESNLDFLHHSMSVYDWTPLVERMVARGAIEILISADAEHASNVIQGGFRAHNPMGMDGTYIYRHQRTAVTREIERKLEDKFRTALMGLGFFQDEVNMMGQTYKNLERGDARMMREIKKSPQMPLFIVGTGPSLTDLLPFLKKNQDKAVIFACGSAIDVIMANGIQPDAWIMMERSTKIDDQARETAEMFDLSEVRFIGSTTIFPKVPTYFKEALFFFRPGLCPAPLFMRHPGQVARMPDPLAANAGLSVGLHLGFRQFYFVGVDVGSKFKDKGHAAGSWYDRHNAENINNLGIPLPGNFGGTVWTTTFLQWSKESLEKLISVSGGRNFFNLGDGALIKGVTPKHPKAVKLKPLSRSKKDLVDELIEQCPIYTEAEFAEAWEKGAIIDRLPEFIEELRRIVLDDDMKEFDYLRETSKLLVPTSSSNAMAMLLRGSVFMFNMGMEFYHLRLADQADREVFERIYREEYDALLNTMEEKAIEVFTGLEEGKEWVEYVY